MNAQLRTALVAMALIALAHPACAQSLLGVNTAGQPAANPAGAPIAPAPLPAARVAAPAAPAAPVLVATAYNPNLRGALDLVLIAWGVMQNQRPGSLERERAQQGYILARQRYNALRTSGSRIYPDTASAVAAFAHTYRESWGWMPNSAGRSAATFSYQEAFADMKKLAVDPYVPVDRDDAARQAANWYYRTTVYPPRSTEHEIARFAHACYLKQLTTPRQLLAQR